MRVAAFALGLLLIAGAGCPPSGSGGSPPAEPASDREPASTTDSPPTRPDGDAGADAADASSPRHSAQALPEVAPAPGNQDAPEPIDIPSRFHGRYAGVGRCDAADDSRLAIDARRIGFHESQGGAVAVSAEGATLTATLELTGEGQTRRADYTFRLEEQGKRLVDKRSGMVRERCAA